MPAHRHLVPPLAAEGHLRLTESELVHWGYDLGRATTAPLIVTLTGELRRQDDAGARFVEATSSG
jgi:hypothetical protein